MNILLSDISEEFSPVDATDYRHLNKGVFIRSDKTCIVIDDDPTGNQTVHDIPLLTRWDQETLVQEFKNRTSTFFLLTNSRSLPPVKASEVYLEISRNIAKASKVTKRNYCIISRSDSTLRGHFPQETNAIHKGTGIQEAIVAFIPVMFEGGRVTIHDIHYVINEEKLTPVNKTPFAKDHSFGYTQANLKKWVQEKTKGSVIADEVFSFSIENIRTQHVLALKEQLIKLPAGTYCIVNAMNYQDLDKIVHALLLAEQSGKKIIYRTSSSFVPSYIGIQKKELLSSEHLFHSENKAGGLIVVGSYVPKSSEQLHHLLGYLENDQVIEVSVEHVLKDGAMDYLTDISQQIDKKIASGKNIVIYTSRKLITGNDIGSNLNIGSAVSEALVTIIKKIHVCPKYLIAKGGITSHDLATKGLGMTRSIVIGQVSPGIPVWKMGNETKFPNLPYIVFPGNVGDKSSLMNIIQKLS